MVCVWFTCISGLVWCILFYAGCFVFLLVTSYWSTCVSVAVFVSSGVWFLLLCFVTNIINSNSRLLL